MRERTLSGAVALVVAGLALAGCSEVEEPESSEYQPARLEPVRGTDVKRVRFTAEAMGRVGVRTAAVERHGRRERAVDYEALLYDARGGTWVYTVTGPASFLRTRVEVARVEGDVAVLTDGPPAGAQVVTVGAAEVFGSEFEVGH